MQIRRKKARNGKREPCSRGTQPTCTNIIIIVFSQWERKREENNPQVKNGVDKER